MPEIAKTWHFDPKNTTKNSSTRPNQLHGSVYRTQMTLPVVKNHSNLFFFLALAAGVLTISRRRHNYRTFSVAKNADVVNLFMCVSQLQWIEKKSTNLFKANIIIDELCQ